MPAIYDWKHVVSERDLDDLGHANNISYLKWMQSASLAHSAAQGWPIEAYRALGQGWVVRSHYIEYLTSALLGDEIVVRTWVANLKKVTSLRRYHMIQPARSGGESFQGHFWQSWRALDPLACCFNSRSSSTTT